MAGAESCFIPVRVSEGATAPERGEAGRGHAAGRDPASERDRDHRGGRCCERELAAGSGGLGGGMITPPSGQRVWLVGGATDLRKGFDGLAALVQEKLRDDPFGGNSALECPSRLLWLLKTSSSRR